MTFLDSKPAFTKKRWNTGGPLSRLQRTGELLVHCRLSLITMLFLHLQRQHRLLQLIHSVIVSYNKICRNSTLLHINFIS
ncbi:hypothetical protein NC652_021188 [Populus alba x Populus x berolinensis]|nr:hypothetical protein NC652_021188 [Populus alba x Populus x berolinensis]